MLGEGPEIGAQPNPSILEPPVHIITYDSLLCNDYFCRICCFGFVAPLRGRCATCYEATVRPFELFGGFNHHLDTRTLPCEFLRCVIGSDRRRGNPPKASTQYRDPARAVPLDLFAFLQFYIQCPGIPRLGHVHVNNVDSAIRLRHANAPRWGISTCVFREASGRLTTRLWPCTTQLRYLVIPVFNVLVEQLHRSCVSSEATTWNTLVTSLTHK